MQVQRTMKAIQIDEQCDVCSVGYMRSTGVQLLSYPPQYPHRCTNCKCVQVYSQTFPYITHIPE